MKVLLYQKEQMMLQHFLLQLDLVPVQFDIQKSFALED